MIPTQPIPVCDICGRPRFGGGASPDGACQQGGSTECYEFILKEATALLHKAQLQLNLSLSARHATPISLSIQRVVGEIFDFFKRNEK